MTTTLEAQKLQFPFDTEYTIDNGANWTALAANTLVTIEPEDMNEERKISVRSSSADATTLEGMDIGVTDVYFSEINIRNATGLTAIDSAFEGIVSDRFLLSNATSLLSSTYMLKGASVKEVFIDELPVVKNSYNMFMEGSFGYVSKIRAGRLNTDGDTYCALQFYQASVDVFGGADIDNSKSGARYMFREASVGASGHMKYSIPVMNDTVMSDYMMYSASIEYLPSYKIVNNVDDIYAGDHFVQSFYNLNSESTDTYIPSFEIQSFAGDYQLTKSFLSGSPQFKFGGISISVGEGVDSYLLSYTEYPAYAKKYISRLNIKYGNVLDSDVAAALGVDVGKRTYYSNPNWFPHVSCLGVYSNSSFSDTIGAGPIGLTYKFVKQTDTGISFYDSLKYKSARKTIAFDTSYKSIDGAGSVVAISKAGHIAYMKDGDIIIQDKDGAAITTISGVTGTAMNFSADSFRLYIVNSQPVDKSGTSGQQMTGTIDTYFVTTGEKDGSTINVPLSEDEWVAGMYQKDQSYGLKVVVNVWSVEQDADGNDLPYAFKEVRVDSYEPSGVSELRASEVSGSGECTYVMNDYFESNEFGIVDAVAGTIQRVVGK